MWSFYNWIRESVRTDKPWNKFAYEIFTSSGDTRQNGALNFYVLHKDPIDLAETSTEAFMGNRVTCARCHNHPLEKWTQKQYYSMVNLFARVGLKNGDEPGDTVVFTKNHRRRGASAPAQTAAAYAARWATPMPLDLHRRPPRTFRRLAGQSREFLFLALAGESACGQTSWVAAWSSRWTMCAPPTPPPTRNCSPS